MFRIYYVGDGKEMNIDTSSVRTCIRMLEVTYNKVEITNIVHLVR